MAANTDFRVGVIRPVECFREGWELIKDQYWMFFGISLVGMLIGGIVPFGIVLGAMMCGIYYCLFQKAAGQRISFDGLFKGFDFFLPSLIVTLFLMVPAFFLWILMYVPMIGIQIYAKRPGADPNVVFPLFFLMMAFLLIGGIAIASIHAMIMFAYPLIVERRLSGMDAFKTSARAVLKNLGGVVGLIVCEIGLVFVGYLLLCIGVYFVVPIMFAGVFVAYRKVFPPVEPVYNSPPPPPNFANQTQWR